MINMEATANTHAVTVTTMPTVTKTKERVQMGVEEIKEEVTVNNVSVSKLFFTNQVIV